MARRVDRDRPPDIEAEAIVERDRRPREGPGSARRIARYHRATEWVEIQVPDELARKMRERDSAAD